MSLDFEKGLFIRIVELKNGPHPMPLDHGFSAHGEYRVLGIYNPSESGECWLILSNDRDEIWYISQRHVRTVAIRPDEPRLRLPRHDASLPPGNHPGRVPVLAEARAQANVQAY